MNKCGEFLHTTKQQKMLWTLTYNQELNFMFCPRALCFANPVSTRLDLYKQLT